jgi:HD-like signal output (HDOD) protein/CheY-like chemotaxis protein
MHFAESGLNALEIISIQQIDVIVTDMRMPGMKGDELLRKIQVSNPGTLRIILSGYNDEILIVKSLSSAHQYLTKPCEHEKLKATIDSAFALKNQIENQTFLKFVNGLDELPVLPQIYIEIDKELSKSDISFKKIADIITDDPVLSAKILQVVNSGFFGLAIKINNLFEALNYLGTNLVKAIILYVETFSGKNYSSASLNEIKKIGQHSIYTAEIGRLIAKHQGKNKQDTDMIFISCILHDIGRLLMLKIDNYSYSAKYTADTKNISIVESELEQFGFSHNIAGAYLLGIWGLSKDIIEAVGYHIEPSKINCKENTIAGTVHLANSFANYKKNEFNYDDLDIDRAFVDAYLSIEKVYDIWKFVNNSLMAKK